MSNVTLTIGGREFAVASAEGEEEHIAMLGRMIDDRLRAMGASAAGQSEARMLLFAALVLADDLHEAQKGGAAHPPEDASAIAGRIGALADRIEKLASHLEEAGGAS
ncbi:MAG: cell division protein ZapA [Sphingomonadales bacterium]|nr:cell division protein ZapA [Sphingomonadales bacterium]MDE2568050.1 cell division protein ZapA [Sphingomonadales bacterium]